MRFERFGGIVPRTDPVLLPDMAAQVARNCDLTSGALKPLSVSEPFNTWIDDGALIAGIPEADVIRITKPLAPSEASQTYLCNPALWLSIIARSWVSQIVAGQQVVTLANSQYLSIAQVEHTETGLRLGCYMSPWYANFLYGGPYQVRGPKYQFVFASYPAGGHATDISIPTYASYQDTELPGDVVPLEDDVTSNVYAQWQVTDVAGPRFDEDILVTDFDIITRWFPAGATFTTWAAFNIDLNYTIPQRRHYYYVQSMVTDDDQEGPPSEVSDLITQLPGTRLTVNTPLSSGYTKNKLYRSTTGGDDFLLVDDVDATTYADDKLNTQSVPIPPYGNYPEGVTVDHFLEGSVIHPAQFGVAFYGDTLYASDYYRFHSWPEENTVPFTADIDAIMLTGNTVLVFSDDKVIGVSGSNPEALAKYDISYTARLLDKKTLCRLGSTVFWCTDDGLAASTGGEVQIVTAEYYTREQWQDLDPEDFTASVADSAVFLEKNDGTGLRIDFDEGISAITTYTTTSGGSVTWKSKRFHFDNPTSWEYVRANSDASFTLNVYANGSLAKTVTVTPDLPVSLLPLRYANDWEFEITGTTTVHSLDCFERTERIVSGPVELNAVNSPHWSGIPLRFVTPDRFLSAYLVAQGTDTVPFSITDSGGTTISGSLTPGVPYRFPRTTNLSSLWTLTLTPGQARIDSLTLFPAEKKIADGGVREIDAGGIPPWTHARYVFTKKTPIQSVLVNSDGPVIMRLYYDGATTASESLACEDGVEQKVATPQWVQHFEVDFNDDSAIHEFTVFPQQVGAIGESPVVFGPQSGIRMRRFRFERPGRVAAIQVVCDPDETGNISVAVTADGVSVTPVSGDYGLWTIPMTQGTASEWTVDVSGAGAHTVEWVAIYPETVVAGEPVLRYVSKAGQVPAWAYVRYEYGKDTRAASIRVLADSYPVTVSLYKDNETTASQTVSVPSDEEVAITSSAPFRSLRLTTSTHVRDMTASMSQPRVLGPNGAFLQNEPSWRNLWFEFPDQGTIAAVRVKTLQDASVRVRMTADGTSVTNRVVASGESVRLPRGTREGHTWVIDFEGAGIESAIIMPLQNDRSSWPLVVTAQEGLIPPWLYTRWEVPKEETVIAGQVTSDDYSVTMRIYMDGATSSSRSHAFSDNDPDEITGVSGKVIEVDFGDDNSDVSSFTLFSGNVTPVGPSGIHLTDPPLWVGNRFKFPDRGTWACYSVGADSYPIGTQLVLKPRGGANTRFGITDGYIHNLPRTLEEMDEWTVSVRGSNIYELILMPRNRVQASPDSLHFVSQDTGINRWQYEKYEFPKTARFRSAFVSAESYPITMRIYADGDPVPWDTYTLLGPEEFPFRNVLDCQAVEFDFYENDYRVNEFAVFQEDDIDIPNRGTVMAGRLAYRNATLRFKEKGSFRMVRVDADNYTDMKLTLWADGVYADAVDIPDNGEIKLSRQLPEAREWRVDLFRYGNVQALYLIGREEHTIKDGGIVIHRDSEPFSWLGHRIVSQVPISISSGRVTASAYPVTVRLWSSGGEEVSVTVASERAFRFPRVRNDRHWEMDVEAPDGVLIQDAAVATSMGALLNG